MTKIGKAALAAAVSLSFVSLSAWADVKVRSFADRKDMGQGDTIDVTVQVASNEAVEVGEPQVPEFPDFDLVNSWTTSSTSSKLVQGARGMEFQTLKQVEFHYMLAPQKQGLLTVPAFEINVDGKAYKTVPFSIRVSGQGSGATQMPQGRRLGDEDEMDEAEAIFNQLLQRQGGVGRVPEVKAAPKNPNEAFFIHLDLDKTEAYEGEQITANWYLYSRGNLLALDRLKFPDLKGFWKEIIEEVPALNFTQEVINGVAYRRALLASHALFPIKPGNAVIDEYKVKATVQLPTSALGSFGFGQPYTYSRSSDRVKINVKPLPTEGKPQDFSGAVGQFDVQALVEHSEVPLNQPFALKLRFEGEGNAKLIELPPMSLPAGLESYDTKSDAKFFKNGRSFKEFEVSLIPREPGTVTIPAISVSLFDPKTGKYYTKKTDAVTVKVVGEKSAADASMAAGTPAKGETKKVESGPVFPSIITETEGHAPNAQLPWMLIAAASLISTAGLGWKARRELGTRKRKATLRELLNSRMKKAWKAQKAGEWREASVQTTNVIYTVLGGISGEGGASKELRILLEKSPPSLRRELGANFEKTLDLFQFLSFAPEDAVGDRKESSTLAKEMSAAEKLLNQAIDHVDERDGQ
ncbi:MAG: protein BatD [Bdellovibrionaceae bacterium]|nr:protein BatD [Pseudobdellovibrionaceae bacterium]